MQIRPGGEKTERRREAAGFASSMNEPFRDSQDQDREP
jgi:hypothetical protein